MVSFLHSDRCWSFKIVKPSFIKSDNIKMWSKRCHRRWSSYKAKDYTKTVTPDRFCQNLNVNFWTHDNCVCSAPDNLVLWSIVSSPWIPDISPDISPTWKNCATVDSENILAPLNVHIEDTLRIQIARVHFQVITEIDDLSRSLTVNWNH